MGKVEFLLEEFEEKLCKALHKFFRFLKQELSFSHFLSVNENGLQVVLYMTLITAMLLMIYKRENGMGYSMAVFTCGIEMGDYACELTEEMNREKVT